MKHPIDPPAGDEWGEENQQAIQEPEAGNFATDAAVAAYRSLAIATTVISWGH